MNGIIRIRVCLAAVENDRILLVPHYGTDAGPVQWNLPGGKVEFGESIRQCAEREFQEETGLSARADKIIDVTEVIKPEQPWHSITITFSGKVTGGEMHSEKHPEYGVKVPRWFSAQELRELNYHPKPTIDKTLNVS